MFMSLCNKWLNTVAVKKFGEMSARDRLIALEFAAWLNEQSAQHRMQRTGGTVPQPNKVPDIQEQIDDEIQDYLASR